jgi:hypothetical protein
MATTRFERISSFAADRSTIIGVGAADGSLAVVSGGDISDVFVPQVTGIQKVAFSASAGSSWHGLALNGAGAVSEWGPQWNGIMPASVNGGEPVEDIAAGDWFSLFLRGGAVDGWGLGLISIPSQLAQPATFGERVVKIAAARGVAYALRENGGIIAWMPRTRNSPFIDLTALSAFPGAVTHMGITHAGVGILSGGRFYTAPTNTEGSFSSWVEAYGYGGFTNLWGGYDNFILKNQSVRATGDDFYLAVSGRPMPEIRTRNVSQAHVSGAFVWALTDDGAMWTTSTLTQGRILSGPMHVYEPMGGAGSLSVTGLENRLADCTALFEAQGSLGGALFGFENIAPTFPGAASCVAALAGGGAVVLEPTFVGVSGFVAKTSVVVQVSGLLQTYTGAARSVSLSTIPQGLEGSVVVRYNGSTVAPVAAGAYQVDALLNTNEYFGVGSGQLVIQKAAQTITWQALQDRKVGDAPFPLFANSSSGLAISYTSSDSQVASIAESLVTVRSAGAATLTALQPGNANYLAAAPVARLLQVEALAPVISDAQGVVAVGVGQEYFFQFKARNAAREWLLTPDTILPPGFLFNPLGGTLSGVGLYPGIWRIGVVARNSAGDSAAKEFTLGIFESQTVDVVKKVTINTDSWDVSFPDPFAGTNGTGAAVGQLRYGDEVTFQIAFTQQVGGVSAGAVASVAAYNPPLVQARFSLKGLDSEPAFFVTGEPEFKKITSYSPSGYTNEIYLAVSLKNDALLAFLSDFEADSGTHASCIGEFELVFRRAAKAGGGLDTISTRPFTLRVTRGLF